MQEAGFEDMGEYVLKRHNAVAQYIATRLILDLCKETVLMPRAWLAKRWWDQEGLYLVVSREEAAAAEWRERRVRYREIIDDGARN